MSMSPYVQLSQQRQLQNMSPFHQAHLDTQTDTNYTCTLMFTEMNAHTGACQLSRVTGQPKQAHMFVCTATLRHIHTCTEVAAINSHAANIHRLNVTVYAHGRAQTCYRHWHSMCWFNYYIQSSSKTVGQRDISSLKEKIREEAGEKIELGMKTTKKERKLIIEKMKRNHNENFAATLLSFLSFFIMILLPNIVLMV